MAKKTVWTVRVVNHYDTRDTLPGLWAEQLRYMGLARILSDHGTYQVLEFLPPHGTDSQEWSRQNAERMSSFGINAVAAPKWGG